MYYGWRIVAAAMLALGISNGVSSYSYGLLVMPMGSEFGASRMEMMWGMTASALMSVLISPYVGTLMDKRPARMLFGIGALSLAASLSTISLVRSVWEFILVFATLNCVGGTILGPLGSNTLVARWFSAHRGRALGITAIGTSLGGLLVPLLMQHMINNYGWRTACLTMGCVVLVLVLPVFLLVVRSRPSDLGLLPDGVAPVEGAPIAPPPVVEMPDIWRDATFWRIAYAAGVLMATFTVLLANLVPFAVGHGTAPQQAALLVSTIAVAGVCGKLLFSAFADRVDLKLAFIVAIVLCAAPVLVLTQFHEYPVVLGAAFSVGLASGAFLPAWGAILARIYGPLVLGRVMGRMQPVNIILVMAAMPMTGYLFDATGSYATAFYILAVALAVGVVIFLPVKVKSA